MLYQKNLHFKAFENVFNIQRIKISKICEQIEPNFGPDTVIFHCYGMFRFINKPSCVYRHLILVEIKKEWNFMYEKI